MVFLCTDFVTNAIAFEREENIIIQWVASNDSRCSGYTIFRVSKSGQRVRIADAKKDAHEYIDQYANSHSDQSYFISSQDKFGRDSGGVEVEYKVGENSKK